MIKDYDELANAAPAGAVGPVKGAALETTTRDDVSAMVSPQTVTWVKRSRYNPIAALTPPYLTKIIDTFNNGYLREFALMAEAIRNRDDMIKVCLAKREKAVARHGFEITQLSGLDKKTQARAEQHAEALRYFYAHVTATHVMEQDLEGGFRLLVRQMMEAVGMRYSVHEIIWQPTIDQVTGEPRLTARFVYVPVPFFECTTGRLRFTRQYYGAVMGEDMDPGEWLVTVGEGLMEPLAICYMFKSLTMKDWLSFSEKFGMPGLLGKTTGAKGSQAWNDMVDALDVFGQEWMAVVNTEANIELIEPKGGASALPFQPLDERMNRAIASLCRGADLSTMSSGGGGGHGSGGKGASVQGDESALLEEDDAEHISETFKTVSARVILELFGDTEPLAFLQIVVPEKKDTTDSINRMTFLVNQGVPVSQAYARKELSVPAPEPGEELLVAPQAPEQLLPESPASLQNAASIGREARFMGNAGRQLSAASRAVLQPLIERAVALNAIQDDTAWLAAAAKLRADVPALETKILKNHPELEHVFESVLGTAFASGVDEHAESTAQKPAKP